MLYNIFKLRTTINSGKNMLQMKTDIENGLKTGFFSTLCCQLNVNGQNFRRTFCLITIEVLL
jgi:hypothetical protein